MDRCVCNTRRKGLLVIIYACECVYVKAGLPYYHGKYSILKIIAKHLDFGDAKS